jgi:hypothetical protein
MLRSKVLRLQIAGLAVLAMLVASSAFAESRHLGGTRGGGGHSWSGGHSSSGGHSWSRSTPGRTSPSRGWSSGSRSWAPSRGSSGRTWGPRSSAPRGVAPAWRGGSYRGGSYYRGGVPFHGYNSGARFFGRGRITRFVPYRGGYNVWLSGWGYPFFVPYRFWDPFRFRIGLFVGFNAFYDPLGYYNVYDPWYYPYPPPTVVVQQPAYGDGGYDNRYEYGSSVVRGTVQSADESRDTMWVNDETSHKVVTVLMPPDRALNGVRAGDYVEVSGEWKSDGVFDGHALDRYDPHH